MASDDPPEKPVPENDKIAEQRSAVSSDPEAVSGGIDDEIDERPLTEQVQEVVDDAKALLGTEIAYYRVKMNANLDAGKKVLAFFGLGIAILTAGLTALIWGALMTLAPYIGPGAATAVIAGGSMLLGVLLILAAVKKAKKMPLDGEDR